MLDIKFDIIWVETWLPCCSTRCGTGKISLYLWHPIIVLFIRVHTINSFIPYMYKMLLQNIK